jgi:hypothetical protein
MTALQRFNMGMWGLMRGGVGVLEHGHAQTREYGYGDHTVLDIMMFMRGAPLQVDERKTQLMTQAQNQQIAMERAWQDVVAGYAELKHRSLKV